MGLEEALKKIEELLLVNAALIEENRKLRTRIEELEACAGKSSKTSDKPPSSDSPYKKQGRRHGPSRKPGGVKGHKGHHRQLLDASLVDGEQERYPSHCIHCGEGLSQAASEGTFCQDVVELPETMAAEVPRYRLHKVRCRHCGKRSAAQGPKSPFGPRLQAACALLAGRYRLSKRSVAQLVQELFGVHMSPGTVCRLERRTSAALAPLWEEARQHVKSSALCFADETPWYRSHTLAWMWAAMTREVVVYRIDARRNRAACEALLGTPEETESFLHADRFSVYGNWPLTRRQYCWAHLLRTFRSFAQAVQAASARIGQALVSATEDMFRIYHKACTGELSQEVALSHYPRIKGRVHRAFEEGKQASCKRLRALSKTLLQNSQALWNFTQVPPGLIDPTNNHAERMMRPAVIYRKVSLGTQSQHGERFVERILSFVQSLTLQKRKPFEELGSLLQNPESTPSLLPA